MPVCKVWNKNVHDYVEKFKGNLIEIKAGGCVEMDLDDAHQFLGTSLGIKKKGDGTHDERYFKMLHIEADNLFPHAADDPLRSHFDGVTYKSKAELEARLKQLAHLRAFDDEAEKLATSEVSDLKDKVSALTAQVEALIAAMPAKRGRPKKAAAQTEESADMDAVLDAFDDEDGNSSDQE